MFIDSTANAGLIHKNCIENAKGIIRNNLKISFSLFLPVGIKLIEILNRPKDGFSINNFVLF